MSAQIFPADTTNVLADDFVSLDHWSEYGSTSSDYRLAPEMSLGHGGSLYIPASGAARLVRPTRMVAGQSYLLTCWVHPAPGDAAVPQVQVTDAQMLGDGTGFVAYRLRDISPGWSRLAIVMDIPDGWAEVWLRIARLASLDGGGFFHGLRVTRISESEDTQ